MKYRNDIQVLKGYSILLIVLYHFNHLEHGYTAVIIFITISGYLSSSIKTFINIFKRYIRLIFPCITNIFFIILKYCNDIPEEQFKPLCNEIISTLFVCVNYYFIYKSTDYFNPPDNSLFLHYWYLSVELQVFVISLYLNYAISELLIIISLIIFIYTFPKYISYNYFSCIPRLWEYLFPKIIKYETRKSNIKYLTIIVFLSILVYSDNFIDERIYQIVVVLATYLYLTSSVKINIYILECIGKLSYYIYLAHYPVIKLESLNLYFLFCLTIICTLQYLIYGNNPIQFIIKHKYIYLLLLIIQTYVILYIILGNMLYDNHEEYSIRDNYIIKRIDRYNYCCFTVRISDDTRKVMFVGDSHVFNILGNFYYILRKYDYLIYYKYIHTEFIVNNSTDLYDITDYFHVIINMNLFYDNKHNEYLIIYPKRIGIYLNYLKSKSKYVLYLIPTPVLKRRISCKSQKKYIARNKVDILLYTYHTKQRKGIIEYNLSSIFCHNNVCNLNYNGKCLFADEHHFTINFYKSISNFTFQLIINLLNHSRSHKKRVNCEYILYKNRILRAWKFPYKQCKLYFYY